MENCRSDYADLVRVFAAALESVQAGKSAALARVAELEAQLDEVRRLWLGEDEHALCDCTKCTAIRAALQRPDGAGGE
jgi:hypothetical protein